MSDKKKLIIVVPAYNEAERIEETVKALKRYAPNSEYIESLVYVVNDGSVDNTQSLAKAAGADKVLYPESRVVACSSNL